MLSELRALGADAVTPFESSVGVHSIPAATFCRYLRQFALVPQLLQAQPLGVCLDKLAASNHLIVPVWQGRRPTEPLSQPNQQQLQDDRCWQAMYDAYERQLSGEPFWHLSQCPVLLAPFVEPVWLPDRFTYERSVLERLAISRNQQAMVRSPLTREWFPITAQRFNMRCQLVTIYGALAEHRITTLRDTELMLQQQLYQLQFDWQWQQRTWMARPVGIAANGLAYLFTLDLAAMCDVTMMRIKAPLIRYLSHVGPHVVVMAVSTIANCFLLCTVCWLGLQFNHCSDYGLGKLAELLYKPYTAYAVRKAIQQRWHGTSITASYQLAKQALQCDRELLWARLIGIDAVEQPASSSAVTEAMACGG